MNNSLPPGWASIRLEELVSFRKGKKPRAEKNAREKGFVPYLDIQAIEKGEISSYAEAASSRLSTADDVLVVWDGARSGWAGLGREGAIGSTIMALQPKAGDRIYLYRWLQTQFEHVNTNTRGTGIPHVDPKIFWNLEVPIPPLNEQRRIVAKLETLLARVNACQQRLAKIPILLKRFHQSVLAAACSGRLTADWREKNPMVESGDDFLRQVQNERRQLWETIQLRRMTASGRTPANEAWQRRYREPTLGSILDRNELPRTWTREKLDAVLAYIEAGKSFACEERPPLENEFGVLKVSAVTWGEFNEKESKTCKEEGRINFDIQVRVGDFLFSRANTIELVGAAVIVKQVSSKLMLSDKTLRLQLAGSPKEYVLYSLRSPAGRAEIERLATGNQNSMRNIGQDRIREIVIPFPPLPEQQEIVRRVEALFVLADQIEVRYAKAEAHVDKLTQSILAKAFRGELVPQDPNDEPASILLDRIHANRGLLNTSRRNGIRSAGKNQKA